MSFAPCETIFSGTRLRRRMVIALLVATAMLLIGACSSTTVYNWKPQVHGQSAARKPQAIKPGTQITPQSVLDDSAAPEHQPMWVAVPAGRDGSIVWVQTTRGVAQRR